MKRGGQVSIEYLLVLGLAFMILLPGGYLLYSFSQGSQDQVAGANIARAGTNIVATAESMYRVGKNSWNTIEINFPMNVRNVYIIDSDNELVIEYDTQVGVSEAVFFSRVNISGPPGLGGNISPSFEPGLTAVKVTPYGNYVEIREDLE